MSWMSADMRRMLIILHFLFLCMLKMAASNKLEICTPGKGYDCAVNATCVARHCDCDLPMKGNGFLQCVHQEQMLCTVAEDLQVTAFQGASAHIYLPCRYRIAEFYTRYNGSDMATHYCFFRVSGFNKIKDGHQHLGGFELIFFTMNNLKEEGFMKGFLKFSIDSLGIHSGNDTPLSWGSSEMDWKDLKFESRVDETEEFSILEVKQCGVTLKFRPHESLFAGRRRHRMAGIVIVAPNDIIVERSGLPSSPSFPLCGLPASQGGHNQTFEDRKAQLGLTHRRDVVLYDMLEAGIGQKLIYGTNELLPFGSQCQMASGLFQGCPPGKKSSAIRSCNEILRNARLVTCLGSHLMEAFNTCLDQVCQGNLCSYTFPELKCGDLPDDLVNERKLYCP